MAGVDGSGTDIATTPVRWQLDGCVSTLSPTRSNRTVTLHPAPSPTAAACVVTVTSILDPTKSASLEVTVVHGFPLRLVTTGFADVQSVWSDAAGNVYFAGPVDAIPPGYPDAGEPPPSMGGFVIKVDADGDLVWEGDVGNVTADRVEAAAFAETGESYVVGSTTSGGAFGWDAGLAGDFAGFLLKLDPDGGVAWSRVIATPSYTAARSVALGPSGSVMVGGHAYGDAAVWSFGADDGFPRWEARVPREGYQAYCYGLAVDPAGASLLVGQELGLPDGGSGGFIARFDADGGLSWVLQPEDIIFPLGVVADPSGAIYVVGPASGDAGVGFVSRYEPDGRLSWSHRAGVQSYEYPRAVTLAREGGIYVAGPEIWVTSHWNEQGQRLADLPPLLEEPYPTLGLALFQDATGRLFLAGSATPDPIHIVGSLVKMGPDGGEDHF